MKRRGKKIGLWFGILVLARTIVASAGEPLDAWRWRNPLPQGNGLSSVTHGDGLFVAVGSFGTVVTSPDGLHWTAQNSGSVQALGAVAYGNGTFVAVGRYGTAISSQDGVTWSKQPSPTRYSLYGVAGVAYGNET